MILIGLPEQSQFITVESSIWTINVYDLSTCKAHGHLTLPYYLSHISCPSSMTLCGFNHIELCLNP